MNSRSHARPTVSHPLEKMTGHDNAHHHPLRLGGTRPLRRGACCRARSTGVSLSSSSHRGRPHGQASARWCRWGSCCSSHRPPVHCGRERHDRRCRRAEQPHTARGRSSANTSVAVNASLHRAAHGNDARQRPQRRHRRTTRSLISVLGPDGGTGRRRGLKPPGWQHLVGSIPTPGTAWIGSDVSDDGEIVAGQPMTTDFLHGLPLVNQCLGGLSVTELSEIFRSRADLL